MSKITAARKGARERANLIGYPRSGLTENDLFALWLTHRKERPSVDDRMREGQEDEPGDLFSALNYFVSRTADNQTGASSRHYLDITTDLWMFLDLYKDTGIWGKGV